MANTTSYNNKLPDTVRKAMHTFARNECLLVKKKLDANTVKANNCHYNVQEQIKQDGGEIINGWLLRHHNRMLEIGLWRWTYHSIWKKNDKQIYDITEDLNYPLPNSVFWVDDKRSMNFVEGIAYNDIIVFETDSVASKFDGRSESKPKANTVYWATTDLKMLRDVGNYNGQYRYIRPEFPNNYLHMEKNFNVQVVDGKLKSTIGASAINTNILFEYSLSART
jgi:hypothetical protein